MAWPTGNFSFAIVPRDSMASMICSVDVIPLSCSAARIFGSMELRKAVCLGPVPSSLTPDRKARNSVPLETSMILIVLLPAATVAIKRSSRLKLITRVSPGSSTPTFSSRTNWPRAASHSLTSGREPAGGSVAVTR